MLLGRQALEALRARLAEMVVLKASDPRSAPSRASLHRGDELAPSSAHVEHWLAMVEAFAAAH